MRVAGGGYSGRRNDGLDPSIPRLRQVARLIAFATIGLTVPAGSPSAAYRCRNIDTFNTQTDGSFPYSGLVKDSAGNFYGTTAMGGTYGFGNIFKLAPPSRRKPTWTQTNLYSFQDDSGGCSPGELTIGATGNLFGISTTGGYPASGSSCSGTGVVFELSPPRAGSRSWVFSVLHRFQDPGQFVWADGAYPWFSRLLLDSTGNLYGTTAAGGWIVKQGIDGTYAGSDCDVLHIAHGCGTVYELSPPTASSALWTETILHNFVGNWFSDPNFGSIYDTGDPRGGVVMDGRGNLYGTTWDTYPNAQGQQQVGTVFELSPPTGIAPGWTETILYGFNGTTDGGSPVGPPLLDPAGDLFVAASGYDGYSANCGAIVEVPASGSATSIYSFNHVTGCAPEGGVVEDAKGKLYGTTVGGGAGGGTVFSLIPPAPGSTNWTETVLEAFGAPLSKPACPGAQEPYGEELLLDSSGDIFGTGDQAVFELVRH